MACKVVGTELVFGVLTIIPEVDGPLAQQVHVSIGEPVGIAINTTDSIAERQYVSALFNGHVTAKATTAIGTRDGVNLAVSMRIGSEIVAGKLREPPARGVAAIVEDGTYHGLLQVGVVAKEERCFGIGQVNGIDTTIGVVLLREEEQLVVLVLKEFVGGDDVPIAA